jgi:hypothetical protein
MNDREKLELAIKTLKQCANPAGAYSLDRLEHAENTIKNIALIAQGALTLMGEDYTNVEIEQ